MARRSFEVRGAGGAGGGVDTSEVIGNQRRFKRKISMRKISRQVQLTRLAYSAASLRMLSRPQCDPESPAGSRLVRIHKCAQMSSLSAS